MAAYIAKTTRSASAVSGVGVGVGVGVIVGVGVTVGVGVFVDVGGGPDVGGKAPAPSGARAMASVDGFAGDSLTSSRDVKNRYATTSTAIIVKTSS